MRKKTLRRMPWGTERIVLAVMREGGYLLLFVFSLTQFKITEFLPHAMSC